MIYRTLGRTGLSVSLLGMGTGGWGMVGREQGRRPITESLLRRALELGINLFDTAGGYMDSELVLGKVLRGLPRDSYVVSDKLGVGPSPEFPHFLPADQVAGEVEKSLERLGMDHMDLLLIVSSGPGCLPNLMEEYVPILEKLRDEGKVGFLGLTEASKDDGRHEWIDAALNYDVFDIAMVAHNMINQWAKKAVFPTCETKNIGVMNIFTVRQVFSMPERLREVVGELVEQGLVEDGSLPDEDPLGWLISEGGCESMVEAAYRYAAYTAPVSTVMTGTVRVDHLEQNVRMVEKGPLPQEHLDRLERVFERVGEPIGN